MGWFNHQLYLDIYIVEKIKFELFQMVEYQDGISSADLSMTLRVHGNRWIGRSGCWIKFKFSIGSVSAQDEFGAAVNQKVSSNIPPDRWTIGPLDPQEGFKVCQRKPPAHFLRMSLVLATGVLWMLFFGGKHENNKTRRKVLEDVHIRWAPDAVINGMKYPYK